MQLYTVKEVNVQKEKNKEYQDISTLRIKDQVFNVYGNHCNCCGEKIREFLCIDHVDGGGTKHRESVPSGRGFYFWLKKNSYPGGYQTLCHNCNLCKGFYGGCQHNKNFDEILLKRQNDMVDTADARKGRRHTNKLKTLVFNHYGYICSCCGERNVYFLCIDHINGGGRVHRKSVGHGTQFYRWLIKNNFPLEFRTLCHNCNSSLGYSGYCPHQLLPQTH